MMNLLWRIALITNDNNDNHHHSYHDSDNHFYYNHHTIKYHNNNNHHRNNNNNNNGSSLTITFSCNNSINSSDDILSSLPMKLKLNFYYKNTMVKALTMDWPIKSHLLFPTTPPAPNSIDLRYPSSVSLLSSSLFVIIVIIIVIYYHHHVYIWYSNRCIFTLIYNYIIVANICGIYNYIIYYYICHWII